MSIKSPCDFIRQRRINPPEADKYSAACLPMEGFRLRPFGNAPAPPQSTQPRNLYILDTASLFCSGLQPFPCHFNGFVKLLLQQFTFRQFGHVFGYLDTAFIQLQKLYLLAGFSGTED